MPNYCQNCKGTGRDDLETAAMYKRETSSSGYIQCRACNGNGLDPAAYFRFSNSKEKNELNQNS